MIEHTPDEHGPQCTFLACCNGYCRCSNCGATCTHLDEIVIAVDGACRFNGRRDIRPPASCGVFVGTNFPYNRSILLNAVYTNQVAELKAGLNGLLAAMQVIEENPEHFFDTVVIKADSEYLVRGMTEWVHRWQHNGWRTANGRVVVNRDHFEELMEAVNELIDMNVKVLFWHVRKEFNEEADRLANTALDALWEVALKVVRKWMCRLAGNKSNS